MLIGCQPRKHCRSGTGFLFGFRAGAFATEAPSSPSFVVLDEYIILLWSIARMTSQQALFHIDQMA